MKYLMSLILCLFSITLFAQKINNVKIEQKGGELIIQYDLINPQEIPFIVYLEYSPDNKTWKGTEKAYGEVGDSIYPGMAKKVVFWVGHIEDIQANMYFKLVAKYYAVEKKNNGNLKDKTGYTYNWVRYGKTKWMAENLKKSSSDKNCGGLFNHASAKNACPDGWHLPSDKDWMDLELQFGVAKNKVNEHGLREINLSKLKNSGFIIEECKYKTSFYPNQKAIAFWTSTENQLLYTGYSDKYLARIVRLNEGKISKELRNKSEELNVRCVQGATYLTSIEAKGQTEISMVVDNGTVNHPFTGEKQEWQNISKTIWLKDDITGIYNAKQRDRQCPDGWRLPYKEEWEALFKQFKPSIELENEKEVLSERISSKGIWGMNLSSNDYWMNIKYYTYNTYWINEADKEDSKKLIAFPTNDKGSAGWEDKQTNEKAKVRCVLDNEDFFTNRKTIKTGVVKDNRDQKEYQYVEIDNKVWMSENLSYNMGENSTCRNNILKDCELFGHMYNVEVSNKCCPQGWRLPTSDEWKYLLMNKAANNIKILYPFGGTGFNLLLGGDPYYDEIKKEDVFTAKYLFLNGDKAGYYYIDSNGKVELNAKAKKKDFYYVRCIKEENNRF